MTNLGRPGGQVAYHEEMPMELRPRSGVRDGYLKEQLTMKPGFEFNPLATCRAWDPFLLRITGGDATKASDLELLASSWLLGCTGPRPLYLFVGYQASGLPQFLWVMRRLFGSFAEHSDIRLFKRDHGPTGLKAALLDGVQLLTVDAYDYDYLPRLSLTSQAIANLAEGRPFSGAYSRSHPFPVNPVFTPCVSVGSMPLVPEASDELLSRVRVVTFPGVREELFEDPSSAGVLSEELEQELPGIYNHLQTRLPEVQAAGGLIEPAWMKTATRQFRQTQRRAGDADAASKSRRKKAK